MLWPGGQREASGGNCLDALEGSAQEMDGIEDPFDTTDSSAPYSLP